MDDGEKVGGTEATSFNTHLFEQVRDMHRTWIERLQEIREIDSDFGMRLLAAKSRSEAANICGEWMAKHAETIAREQKTFANAWLRLVVEMMGSTSVASTKASERDRKSAG
jgi:hypothetical protein